MTISIVTGLPGFGKTLKLAEFGVKAMDAGKPVYANFRMHNLRRPELYTHFNDPLEVLGKVSNALILMSEVGILLDQMRMYQIDPLVWDELRQHRKDGVNIIADAQSMGDVSYMFRRLIQFQYHIYSKMKVFPSTRLTPHGLTLQLVRVFNPQPKGADYGRRYWKHDTSYFQFYDTNYKLEKTESLYDQAQRVIEAPYAEGLYDRYGKILRDI